MYQKRTCLIVILSVIILMVIVSGCSRSFVIPGENTSNIEPQSQSSSSVVSHEVLYDDSFSSENKNADSQIESEETLTASNAEDQKNIGTVEITIPTEGEKEIKLTMKLSDTWHLDENHQINDKDYPIRDAQDQKVGGAPRFVKTLNAGETLELLDNPENVPSLSKSQIVNIGERQFLLNTGFMPGTVIYSYNFIVDQCVINLYFYDSWAEKGNLTYDEIISSIEFM